RRLADQPGPPVDAQRVVAARYEEQQADLRVAEDVDDPVEPPVAGAVRDGDRGVIEHLDESRRVTLGGHVAPAVRRAGRDQAERRGGEPTGPRSSASEVSSVISAIWPTAFPLRSAIT